MENNKYKIIAIFGPRGSGKDALKHWIGDAAEVNLPISATTRPPREHETDGVDYYFLSKEEFNTIKENGRLIEDTEFRGWYYGTPIYTLDEDKVNVGIFNVAGLRHILKDTRLSVYPVYIYCSDKERLLRQLFREEDPDCTEICRRFGTDKADFRNVNFQYYTIYNDGDLAAAGTELMNYINEILK